MLHFTTEQLDTIIDVFRDIKLDHEGDPEEAEFQSILDILETQKQFSEKQTTRSRVAYLDSIACITLELLQDEEMGFENTELEDSITDLQEHITTWQEEKGYI